CATSIYRNQWDKINGAPNSAVLNIEANLTKYFPGGVGIAFYHDAIGFARQNNVLLNYSYPIQIGRAGVLGIGVGLGIMNYGLNPDWVPPTNNPDPTLPVGFAATSFDANFGLYFNGKDFYGGISSTHLSASLLQQSVAGFSQSYQTARHYYIMGGKRFKKIGPGDIDAQVLLRTEFVKFSADINARYILDLPGKKQIYGGFTYRTSDAVALMVGYTPIPKMTVGYSYDLTINKLSSISRGSHELVVKYCYYLPPPPKQRARHPRWL
ncbi:MAG: type IX secretion system membrane protein PorP/SprF, partial [Crocinitomicaceae bacterium]|nr:type IX secretion system membrane protein PorP/SprF [Crocinitomicaceae bacterium]